MNIEILQDPKTAVNELTKLLIVSDALEPRFVLDLDFSSIMSRSWTPNLLALDFLVISSIVYAVDKIVQRKSAPDHWTRNLNVSIPVRDPSVWNAASSSLAHSVSFLTGDSWTFNFFEAKFGFQKRRANRRIHPKGFPSAPAVSLLSGGMDSFIGALDLLHQHPERRIVFVSHYDRHVSGPASEQSRLITYLEQHFPRRLAHLQVRSGVTLEDPKRSAEKYTFETSFRSRSLIFLGLGLYAAAKIGPQTPVIIPENGPISLNMPLNSSRRGACSTRTVHPFFVSELQKALRIAGLSNPILNPYAFKTKGEMAKECSFPELLLKGLSLTNSCGKAGRKTHWKNRRAKGCGTCVPCLYRLASIHALGATPGLYGNDVLNGNPADYPDFHAMLGLIHANPSREQIAKTLLCNGRLPLSQLDEYSGVVYRMIAEVRQWISDKGSSTAKKLAGIESQTVSA